MNAHDNPATTFRRGPLAVLLTGIFLIVLDFFVVNVALPSVQQDLDADATALQWLVAGYALTFGGLLLVASRLADRWGRRRMFLLGTGLFVLSSAICGFAPDVDTLLVARLVQGASAAMVAPTVLVPHRRRVRRAAAGPRARRLRHGDGRGRRLRPAHRRAADPPGHRRIRLAVDLPGQRADRHRRPRRRAAAAAGHPGRHPAPGRRRDGPRGRRADRTRAAAGPGAEPGVAAVDLGDPRRCRGPRRPRRLPGRRAAPSRDRSPRRRRADACSARRSGAARPVPAVHRHGGVLPGAGALPPGRPRPRPARLGHRLHRGGGALHGRHPQRRSGAGPLRRPWRDRPRRARPSAPGTRCCWSPSPRSAWAVRCSG